MQGMSAPLGTEILASANSSAAKLRAWPCLGESTLYSSTPLRQGKFTCAVVRGFLDALNSLDVPTLYFTWLQSIQGNEFKLRCQKIFLVSSTLNKHVVGTTGELWKEQVHGKITVFTKPVCCYTQERKSSWVYPKQEWEPYFVSYVPSPFPYAYTCQTGMVWTFFITWWPHFLSFNWHRSSWGGKKKTCSEFWNSLCFICLLLIFLLNIKHF